MDSFIKINEYTFIKMKDISKIVMIKDEYTYEKALKIQMYNGDTYIVKESDGLYDAVFNEIRMYVETPYTIIPKQVNLEVKNES